MALLSFSDILIKAGLDPKRVKLIRHALSDKAFKKCYDKNMVLEYTQNQSITFSQNYDYLPLSPHLELTKTYIFRPAAKGGIAGISFLSVYSHATPPKGVLISVTLMPMATSFC